MTKRSFRAILPIQFIISDNEPRLGKNKTYLTLMSSFCRRTICLLVSMLVHRCQLTHKCAQLCIKHLTRILFQFVVENVFPLHIIELRRCSFISQEGHWPPHSSIHQPHTTLSTLGSRMHPDRYINIGTKTIPYHPLEITAWYGI